MNGKKIAAVVVIGLATVTPLLALAQPLQSVDDFVGVMRYVATTIQTLFWIVAAIFIIWAAFKYLTAQGDPEKVGTARQMLIYAVIAIAIALLATVIDNIVEDLLQKRGTGGSIR